MTATDLKRLFEIDPEILRAPRRDNSAYLEAIARMRQGAVDAEIALGGPAYIAKFETDERDGNYTVTVQFRRREEP